MNGVEVELLSATDSRSVFLAKVLDDFGLEGSFRIEFSGDVQTPAWLQGRDLSEAARVFADEIVLLATGGPGLAGRRFRFSSSTTGSTVDMTVMRIRSNGLSAFDVSA